MHVLIGECLKGLSCKLWRLLAFCLGQATCNQAQGPLMLCLGSIQGVL